MNKIVVKWSLLMILAAFLLPAEIVAQAPTRAQLTPVNTTGSNNKSGAFRVVLYIPEDTLNTTDSGAIAYVAGKLLLKSGTKWTNVGSAQQMDDSTIVIGGDTIRIPGVGNAWSLTGNTTGDPNNTFIGTVDGYPLRFRTADILRMVLDSATSMLSIVDGTDSLQMFVGTESRIMAGADLSFFTNGSARLNIKSSGFIGVGGIEPLALLDVAGLSQFRSGIRIYDPENSTDVDGGLYHGGSSLNLQTDSEHPIVISTDQTSRAAFTETGLFNVFAKTNLIGDATAPVVDDTDSTNAIETTGRTKRLLQALREAIPTFVGAGEGLYKDGDNIHLGRPIGGSGGELTVNREVPMNNNMLAFTYPASANGIPYTLIKNNGLEINGDVADGIAPTINITDAYTTSLLIGKTTGLSILNFNNKSALYAQDSDGKIIVTTPSGSATPSAFFDVDGTGRYRSSLLVGTNSSVLSNALKVENSTNPTLGIVNSGTAGTTGGGVLKLGQYQNGTSDGNRYGAIDFLGTYTTNSAVGAAIEGINEGGGDPNSGIAGARLTFRTKRPGTPNQYPTESMRIDGFGFVQIMKDAGTTAPWFALHVRRPAVGSNNTIASTGYTSGGGGNFYAGIYGTDAGSSVNPSAADEEIGRYGFGIKGEYTGMMAAYSSASWASDSRPTYLSFNTTPSGSTTMAERMRITERGHIGINTTTPFFGLTVNRSLGLNKDSLPIVTDIDPLYVLVQDTTGTGRVSRILASSIAGGGGGGITGFTDGNGFDGTVSGSNLSLTTSLTTGSIPFIGSSGAVSEDNNQLYWDNTNKLMGIGTTSPVNKFHAFASDASGLLAATFEKETSTLGSVVSVMSAKATSTGDAANGFGPTISFQLQDNAGTPNLLGAVGYVRTGADNNGDFVVRPAAGGVANERLRLSNAGVLTVTSNIVTSSNIQAGASSSFLWSGRSNISSPADGQIMLRNNANNNFDRLILGPNTSSFPAIKRVADSISLVKGDDSGPASLKAGGITLSNRLQIIKGSGITPDLNNVMYLGRNDPGNFYPLGIFEDQTDDGYAQFGVWGKARKWNFGVGNGPSNFFNVQDKFYILDATSNDIRFSIDTDGKTGINTASPTATLDVNGTATVAGAFTPKAGVWTRVQTVTSNTTLDNTYHTVLIDASGGNISITLPSAASCYNSGYGLTFILVRIDNNVSNTVTVNSSDNINGGPGSFVINTSDRYKSKILQAASSTEWYFPQN